MQSFEHLCGERKIVLQYGDIVRSLPKDNFSLVKQKVSGGQEQEQVFVAMEFTDQVTNEVAMESVGTCYLGYDGDNSNPTRTIISHNILGPGNNYYIISTTILSMYY